MAGNYSVFTSFGAKDRMSPVFNKMGKSASIFGGVLKANLVGGLIQKGFTSAVNGMKSFVTEASKIENSVAAFQPLLGSVDKAQMLVERLNKEAASTPFQFEGIASVAKQLLPVMNGSIENTADTFRMLGDTAGGNIQKLETITRGYTKALLKGKPDLESLNMISEAGVPIFAEMSKRMGITTQELFKMSSAGKLTNKDLTDTFKAMTSEGGVFFRGMEIASQTLTGKWSTLTDNINLTKAVLGTQLLPIIKPLIDKAIEMAGATREWVTANQGLISGTLTNAVTSLSNVMGTLFNTIKSGVLFIANHKDAIINLGIALASWKLAIMAVNAVLLIQKGLMIAGPILTMIKLFMSLAKTEGILATAQFALNTAMSANPIGLIIIGISALIGLVALLIKNWDVVGPFFASIWEGMKKGFMFMIDIIKKQFFTFADIFLTTWGNIIKAVIIGASKIGSFLGFDTTGLDNVISKINTIQKSVRDQSIFGDIQSTQKTELSAPNQREAEARQQVQFNGQLNIAGAPEGSTFSGSTMGAPPVIMQMLGARK